MFRAFGEAYRSRYVLTPGQQRAFDAIVACRTEALGGHLDVCNHCGHEVPAYNSCLNRHCMKCQSLRQAKWVLERMRRVLPVPYFHVVFTLPSELQPLARRNQRVFYKLLFDTASRTLLDLAADPKWLGATPGITAVLHTWRRDLGYHPHAHCIVTGGGLSPDGTRWLSAGRGRFLFPVRVLSALFRGKFLARLTRLVDDGDLDLGEDVEVERQAFAELRDALYRKQWVVYAKRPFAGPKQVFRYLGLYTHRVGMSNHRLRDMNADDVTFDTKNGETTTISGIEFVRRFLLHVLPARFVKIRHYGLHSAANVNTKLEQARAALAAQGESITPDPVPSTWRELLERLTGTDPRRCPVCKVGVLHRFAINSVTGEIAWTPLPEPDT